MGSGVLITLGTILHEVNALNVHNKAENTVHFDWVGLNCFPSMGFLILCSAYSPRFGTCMGILRDLPVASLLVNVFVAKT